MALKRPFVVVRQRGFTLVELLAATALFAVLGTMLMQLVQGGMELWSRGERVRDLEERAQTVLELIAEDLRHSWSGAGSAGEAAARFLVETRPLADDAHGALQGRTSVLRFSRLAYEQRSLPWLRRAGEQPGAERASTLSGGEDPTELLPSGGLAEALYSCALLPDQELPVLLRRLRSPLGGQGSLLADEFVDFERLLTWDGVLLVDRVLHFAVRCWAPDTEAWELPAGVQGVAATTAWDSTRGLLAPDDPSFPHGRGAASLLDAHDDMFPPAVCLELVLDPFVESGAAPARLAAELGPEDTRLRLSGSRIAGDERLPRLLWIDGEWLAVQHMKGDELLVERGRRGTAPARHLQGSAVRVGQLFERVVLLPGAREGFER